MILLGHGFGAYVRSKLIIMKQVNQESGTFKKLLLLGIRNIYYAEQKVLNAFFMMEEAAATEELKVIFRDNSFKTEEHIVMLGSIFDIIKAERHADRCETIIGMVNDLLLAIKHTPKGTMTRDAALLMEAQKIETYKVTTYKYLVQISINLGLIDVSNMLAKALLEDEATVKLFNDFSEMYVNMEAADDASHAGDFEILAD